jgi:hypothetical protein
VLALKTAGISAKSWFHVEVIHSLPLTTNKYIDESLGNICIRDGHLVVRENMWNHVFYTQQEAEVAKQ